MAIIAIRLNDQLSSIDVTAHDENKYLITDCCIELPNDFHKLVPTTQPMINAHTYDLVTD